MSRKSREKRLETARRWKALADLLSGYFGQDFWMRFDSFEAARMAAVASLDHRARKQVAVEWWDWNATAGAVADIRAALAHLGIEPPFDTAVEARKFMNQTYDALILAVRSKEPGWKP